MISERHSFWNPMTVGSTAEQCGGQRAQEDTRHHEALPWLTLPPQRPHETLFENPVKTEHQNLVPPRLRAVFTPP